MRIASRRSIKLRGNRARQAAGIPRL